MSSWGNRIRSWYDYWWKIY